MKKHQYRVTVEHVADKEGNPIQREPLQFSAPNHDDSFEIVARIKQRGDMDEETAVRFAVGLKLFSETALENKDLPLFVVLKPHLTEIMQIVKGKK